jgi:hypothetical protein
LIEASFLQALAMQGNGQKTLGQWSLSVLEIFRHEISQQAGVLQSSLELEPGDKARQGLFIEKGGVGGIKRGWGLQAVAAKITLG